MAETKLTALNVATQIIFVTAYEEYAVDVFAHGALDYLMKPVPPERLAATLVRARERLNDLIARQKADLNVDEPIESGVRIRCLPIRTDYRDQRFYG